MAHSHHTHPSSLILIIPEDLPQPWGSCPMTNLVLSLTTLHSNSLLSLQSINYPYLAAYNSRTELTWSRGVPGTTQAAIYLRFLNFIWALGELLKWEEKEVFFISSSSRTNLNITQIPMPRLSIPISFPYPWAKPMVIFKILYLMPRCYEELAMAQQWPHADERVSP